MGVSLTTCRAKNPALICPWGTNLSITQDQFFNQTAAIDKYGQDEPWLSGRTTFNDTWLKGDPDLWNQTWFCDDLPFILQEDSDIGGDGVGHARILASRNPR